ncbi:MAG: hypothetical protein QM702_07580 [Rubrivivax sp.]
MARKPTPAPANKEVAVDEALIQQDVGAANKLAIATIERSERVTQLAAQLNYAGSTEPAVLENGARDAIKRIGLGIFELGAYLLLLRESCAHGQFLPALERLGLGYEAAKRYMGVTRRFANRLSTTDLQAAGVTKLVELLPLDDEQLGELTELGQTGELSLDDVATMSVKQLRAKVRELRQEREADAQLLDKKNSRIDGLEKKLTLIERMPADEKLAKLRKEADDILLEALGTIRGSLRQAALAIRAHTGEEETVLLSGMAAQLQTALVEFRAEFELPDTVGDGTPEWQRWIAAQDAAGAAKAV